jgi:hypothetical protein
VSVATETYAALEAALLRALDDYEEGGPAPIGWNMTSELYRQLDYGADHFATADTAIYYGETPKPLYQLPVSLSQGASHEWKLRLRGDEHG